MFQQAVKYDAKGRVALIGPAGSGKSYTMLTLARLLAGDGKIAAVDTEHGSLSKYADLFRFDVIEPTSYSPDVFFSALTAAEKGGYAVFCVDSLSHFWMGKDGALEYVDQRAKRGNGSDDTFSGWKAFRPHERTMVDRILASPCHVLCTMRTKNEYGTEEQIRNGKKTLKRVKLGLAPVQRDGLEYEFDLVMTLTEANEAVIDKTRCPAYAGKVIEKPGAAAFEEFRNWLRGAEKSPPTPITKPPFTATMDDLPPEMDALPAPPDSSLATARAKPWSTFKGMVRVFEDLHEELKATRDDGDKIFYGELDLYGVKSAAQFTKSDDALACHAALVKTLKGVAA